MKLNTHTCLWTVIDAVMERERAARRKAERAKAREQELAIVRERVRRGVSAAAFDSKVVELRRKARGVA